jgi:hypothetical protein
MSEQRVTIYASWRGAITSLLSPAVLLGLGLAGILIGDANVVAIVLAVIGLVLAAIVVLDYPQRVEFHAAGIDRVCLLRRHRMPWQDIRAIQRARGTMVSYIRLRNAGDTPTAPQSPTGGLVARGANSRRWLLCDRIESQPEFDAIRRIVEDNADWVAISAARPAASTPPTTLYRRGADNPMA